MLTFFIRWMRFGMAWVCEFTYIWELTRTTRSCWTWVLLYIWECNLSVTCKNLNFWSRYGSLHSRWSCESVGPGLQFFVAISIDKNNKYTMGKKKKGGGKQHIHQGNFEFIFGMQKRWFKRNNNNNNYYKCNYVATKFTDEHIGNQKCNEWRVETGEDR